MFPTNATHTTLFYKWDRIKFDTYHEERRQRKIKNISFILQRQCMQTDFMTDTISTFIHTNHKEDSPKLRMLSFIPQRQRIQMDFILDTIRFLMHTKANRNNADSGVFPFKLYTKSTLQTTKSYALSIFSYMQCSMEIFHPSWTIQQNNSKACTCLSNSVTSFGSVLN